MMFYELRLYISQLSYFRVTFPWRTVTFASDRDVVQANKSFERSKKELNRIQEQMAVSITYHNGLYIFFAITLHGSSVTSL